MFADLKMICTFAPPLKNKGTPRGRVVDCGGLENRCAERHPGFESLSLRNKGCKSSFCEIYTLFYASK